MKNYFKTAWTYVRHSKVVKYVVVIVFAVVIIGFADENSVWHHFRNKRTISELQSEIARYTRQHQHDQAEIRRLDADPKAIEKIARERYFMKTDDEDIFVLSDDKPNTLPTEDETAE